MLLQLSSGQGPVECELAVSKLYNALKEEYPYIEFVAAHPSKEKGYYTSVRWVTEQDIRHLDGSVQWICKSPYRPNHKRKNWFVDVSIIPEKEEICKEQDIKSERFHSGGNGGQNVNKVETGVRLIHISTGITVTSTAERSQLLNKKDALRKLNVILKQKEKEKAEKQTNNVWREHTRIVCGNPVRIYEGMEFKRKK